MRLSAERVSDVHVFTERVSVDSWRMRVDVWQPASLRRAWRVWNQLRRLQLAYVSAAHRRDCWFTRYSARSEQQLWQLPIDNSSHVQLRVPDVVAVHCERVISTVVADSACSTARSQRLLTTRPRCAAAIQPATSSKSRQCPTVVSCGSFRTGKSRLLSPGALPTAKFPAFYNIQRATALSELPTDC